MTGLEVALLAWGVLCLALLIIVLGTIDDLRAQLKRERAVHAAQRHVFYTSLAAGMSPDEVARALQRAAITPVKGNRL